MIKDRCSGPNAKERHAEHLAKSLLVFVCVCYHSDCCPLTRQQPLCVGWWEGVEGV